MALVVAFVAPGSVSAATRNVSIVEFAYIPSEVTINPGDEVLWSQVGTIIHTVTEDSFPPVFDSGSMSPGRTFSFTFLNPGRFTYHCFFHPAMQGVVIVAGDGSTTTSTSTSTTTTSTSTTSTTVPPTTTSTSTTVPPTTTTSTSTTVPPTTTTSTSTTVPPTTTTSTSTTVPPTTTTSTSTTSTTVPPTTTSTSIPVPPSTTTTTTTAPPTGGPCDALVASRVAFNAEIERFQAVIRDAFGSAVGPAILAQLEQVRAQGNTQFDLALAACGGIVPQANDTSAAD